MTLSRSILGFIAALALAGALVPAFASAQTPYYYNNNSYSNCATYSAGYPYSTTYPYNNTYPYNYNYSNGYCPPANFIVYVQVNAQVNSFYARKPSDFTVTISGATAYPQTFVGSASGQMVSVVGSYSATAASFQGFTPSYSSGCSGSIVQGQQATCVITENPIYPYNYQPNYPYQQNYTYPYTQPYQYNTPYVAPYTSVSPTVYVTPSYVPSLPNTGFEPQDSAAIAFAAVALIAMAFLSLPYVRKALAAILG